MEERPTIFVDVELSGEGAPDTVAIYGLRSDLTDLGFTLPPLGDFAIPIPDARRGDLSCSDRERRRRRPDRRSGFKRFGRKREKYTGKPATPNAACPTIGVIYGPDCKVLRPVEVRPEGT